MATEQTDSNSYSDGGGGNYFSLFSSEPSIPDANELLSLKILKDANRDAFEDLAREETKWLSVSLGLLRRDPYLQVMMQGRGVRQAMKLAGLLKQKAEQHHFNSRVDSVVKQIVSAKFQEGGWGNLTPNQGKQNWLGYDKNTDSFMALPRKIDPKLFGKDDKSNQQVVSTFD